MDRLLEKNGNGLRRRCLVLDEATDKALSDYAKLHHLSRSATIRALLTVLMSVGEPSASLIAWRTTHPEVSDGT